jgi:myo-inositol-1-phosphate synthase
VQIEQQVEANMTRRRVGLWLIGAFGGVGTTITLGLAAMVRGLADRTGLVTSLPAFRDLPLPEPGDFVIGGHDVRQTSFADSAEEFRLASGVFEPAWLVACRDDLAAASSRVKPGPRLGVSPAVTKMASWSEPRAVKTVSQAVDLISSDLAGFVGAEAIDHLIVLNVASTEPPFPLTDRHARWETLKPLLAQGGGELLPSSSLYALAAIQSGHTYINFTPSLGASLPAFAELAVSTGSLYAGKDGKTGETLMKTVLAPMFAQRNLKVLSWTGHNIFGNRDGMILDDPASKASKVETKDRVITEILGYKPSSIVTIEYLPDMGDWKTAWDHIHFQGFLGTKMTLQFTWQGCDSLLAAPLAIDLARLADLEKQRGAKGLMRHLACFFKSPEGVEENDFYKQCELLKDHVARVTSFPSE